MLVSSIAKLNGIKTNHQNKNENISKGNNGATTTGKCKPHRNVRLNTKINGASGKKYNLMHLA